MKNAMPISSLATSKGLVGGPFGSSLVGNDYELAGVPVIRGTNLGFGKYLGGSFVYVSEEKVARDLARNTAVPGDIVFTQRGTLGQVALVDDSGSSEYVVSQSQMRLRVDPEIASAGFVYYACTSMRFLKQISDNAISTGVPHINLGILGRLTIPLPSLETQNGIAEVLGALDDKIAANSKLLETLDDYFMSRAREFATAPHASSVKLNDLVREMIAGDWGQDHQSELFSESVSCVRGADIPNLQAGGLGKMPIRYIKSASLKRRQVKPEDLVLEMSGGSPTQSTGRVFIATSSMLSRLQTPMISSNFCRVIRLEGENLSFYIYSILRSSWLSGEFFQYENGTTGIKNLGFADYCLGKEVALPSPDEFQAFNEMADRVFTMSQTLGEESSRLRATRDALLPQLMSGKLRVKDAEKSLAGVL